MAASARSQHSSISPSIVHSCRAASRTYSTMAATSAQQICTKYATRCFRRIRSLALFYIIIIMQYIIVQGDACRTSETGVYGSATGSSYSIQPRPISTIKGILVKSGQVLDGLGFIYEDGTQQYGGNSDDVKQQVMLPEGDRLEHVSGKWLVKNSWYGSVVSSITFITEKGVKLGPFGDYKFLSYDTGDFEMSLRDWCTFGISGSVTHRGLTVGFHSEAGADSSAVSYYSKCETIQAPLCMDVWYNTTQMPNVINQTTQAEAIEEVQKWSPLVGAGCSPQLKFFLCTVHVPVCTVLHKPVPPCRSLCKQAKSGCVSLMNFFGYPWPERLECDLFPVEGPCVSEHGIIGELKNGDLVDPIHNTMNITMNGTYVDTGNEGMPDFIKVMILKFVVIGVCSLVGLILGIVACVILVRRFRRRQQPDSPVKHKYSSVTSPVIYVPNTPQPTAVHDVVDEVESQKTQTTRSV